MTYIAYTNCHDADGTPARKEVTEDQVRLMTAGGLLHKASLTLPDGDKLVAAFAATVEDKDRSGWESLGALWQARNVLMHQHGWSKWTARTMWVVKEVK